MKNIRIYLVSDSTGETVSNVAKSAIANFPQVKFEEHIWSFVLTEGKIDKLREVILKDPGIVMFTMADKILHDKLIQMCSEIDVLCIPVLDSIISKLSSYLNIQSQGIAGKQHELNADYFARLEAVNFAITHDDGQSMNSIEQADIIVVGVSRTSKSPTCLYLAYKGIKTANVPYVKDCSYMDDLSKLKKPLIVGLTVNHEILHQIRKNRLINLKNMNLSNKYIDPGEIKEELDSMFRIFQKNNWPYIDVSRRSVEETAALILQLYEKHKIKTKEMR